MLHCILKPRPVPFAKRESNLFWKAFVPAAADTPPCKSKSVPNRIGNGFHKQAAAAELTFCYAVGLCGWISVSSLQEPCPKLLHFHIIRRTGDTTTPHRRMAPGQGSIVPQEWSVPGATVLEWSVHPVCQGHPLGLRLSLLSQLQTRSGVSIASTGRLVSHPPADSPRD